MATHKKIHADDLNPADFSNAGGDQTGSIKSKTDAASSVGIALAAAAAAANNALAGHVGANPAHQAAKISLAKNTPDWTSYFDVQGFADEALKIGDLAFAIKNASDNPSSYPLGRTRCWVGGGLGVGWPGSAAGMVETIKWALGDMDAIQIFYDTTFASSGYPASIYIRHSAYGSSVWEAFTKIGDSTLLAGSYASGNYAIKHSDGRIEQQIPVGAVGADSDVYVPFLVAYTDPASVRAWANNNGAAGGGIVAISANSFTASGCNVSNDGDGFCIDATLYVTGI